MRTSTPLLITLALAASACHAGPEPAEPAREVAPRDAPGPAPKPGTEACDASTITDAADRALAGRAGAVVVLDLESGETLAEAGELVASAPPPASTLKPFLARAAVVVVSYVHGAGSGGELAAPIAREVLTAWSSR
ncbi:MAG: hypothetical protein KC468_38415, partial [Myxococcales bacterium]|nr:hypothetical protein [Myxococcales bacterium]